MNRSIVIQVCSGCGACVPGIMEELSRLEKEQGLPLLIQMEECLDTCDDEPSFAVNGVSIAPASPEKLRAAVERERLNGPQEAPRQSALASSSGDAGYSNG